MRRTWIACEWTENQRSPPDTWIQWSNRLIRQVSENYGNEIILPQRNLLTRTESKTHCVVKKSPRFNQMQDTQSLSNISSCLFHYMKYIQRSAAFRQKFENYKNKTTLDLWVTRQELRPLNIMYFNWERRNNFYIMVYTDRDIYWENFGTFRFNCKYNNHRSAEPKYLTAAGDYYLFAWGFTTGNYGHPQVAALLPTYDRRERHHKFEWNLKRPRRWDSLSHCAVLSRFS